MIDQAVKDMIQDAEEAVAGYVPRCWLWHSYPRWTDVEAGTISVKGEGRIVGRFVTQERRCLRCNAVQLRTAKVTIL